jgi:ribonucleoside-triphosphate reductase
MLIESGYHKDFISLMKRIEGRYGYEIFNIDGIGDQLNISKFNKKFFDNKSATADISIDANSNVSDRGIVTYNAELVKPITRLNSYYMLWKQLRELGKYRMADEIIESNVTGEIYVNDFHGYASSIPYCFNYSTMDLMINGLNMVNNLTCEPPKYFTSFKSQLEQFVIIASNSTLGATGLADMLLTSSLYVENMLDTLSDSHFNFLTGKDVWSYVEEMFTSMIYTFNQPMRASQSPFTNVSVYDSNFLDSMLDNYIHPTTMRKVDKRTVEKVQEVFLSSMNKVMARTVVTFPVITACFSIDNDRNILDNDFLELITTYNSKYHFINLYAGKTSTLSSCCRLRSEQMNEYFNSFGAGSSKIGSLGVVTINLPRLAFTSRDIDDSTYNEDLFFNKLKRTSEQSFYVNYTKRLLLRQRIDAGKHPLYTLDFINEGKQYGTLGFNGFNEAIEIMGYDPLSTEGVEFGKRMLSTMNDVNDWLGSNYKVPVNLEQIPAESVSIKLAKKDRYLGLNNEYIIYSNQFIPLTTNADLLDRIRLQGEYDSFCSGGSILHINKDGDTTVSQEIELTKFIFKSGVIYFAINDNLQMCNNNHVLAGKFEKCPRCNAPVERNFIRVVGFITEVNNWIKERRELDYPNRKFYNKL